MAFDEAYVNEIVENTVPFPYFVEDNDEIVEAIMVTDMEGSDIHKMPLSVTIERENLYSVTTAVYQLVHSNKEFKPRENGMTEADN